MTEAKCTRCGASSTGLTFSEASSKLNHTQGKSRGKPCGSSYGKVIEIKTDTEKSENIITQKTETPKVETPTVNTPKKETSTKSTQKSKSYKKE